MRKLPSPRLCPVSHQRVYRFSFGCIIPPCSTFTARGYYTGCEPVRMLPRESLPPVESGPFTPHAFGFDGTHAVVLHGIVTDRARIEQPGSVLLIPSQPSELVAVIWPQFLKGDALDLELENISTDPATVLLRIYGYPDLTDTPKGGA